MSQLVEATITILLAVVGLAILSVIVSRNSNTAAVIQAGASGFGNSVATAISPVTGAMVSPDLSYPGGGFGGYNGFGGF